MTPMQIDLEFAHMYIDEQERDGNRMIHIDPDYNDEDEDEDKADSKVRIQNGNDWEDVETDDL